MTKPTKHEALHYLEKATEAVSRVPLLELHRIRRRYDVDVMDLIPDQNGRDYHSELLYTVAIVQLEHEAGGPRNYDRAEALTRPEADARLVSLIDALDDLPPAEGADKS